ncbi:MAG: hypothetical protein MUC96_28585 [Myxococcaceae bacterium]|nr:hypothetical protein [Myxococcaceae bacterium]
MNRLIFPVLVVLTGCLDSLTLLPSPEPVVEPRREEAPSTVRDAGLPIALSDVDAGVLPVEPEDAGAVIEQPVQVVDAGAAVDAGAPDAGCSCPAVPNAVAVCLEGVCGRGPCAPGFFDLDPNAPGCESTCQGAVCTGPSGPITLTAPPVAERAHGDLSTTGVRLDSSRGDLGMPGAVSSGASTTHRPFLH